MTTFSRYLGIDYSGAKTPTASLRGLRVYAADRPSAPREILPAAGPRKYWARRGLAEWLAEELARAEPVLVGIDHGFSFPLEYFDAHGLALDWPGFLEDFHRHWPTDGDEVWVRSVLEGRVGNGAARSGERTWRRQTEKRAGAAKSVFHFDVQGSVAKSTHSGLPWLLYLRGRLGRRIHFWPFDGWAIPAGRSAIVEVYPRLWSACFARDDRNQDQHDAYAVAAWLRSADLDGSLASNLDPPLAAADRELAEFEGWILGVR